MGSSGISFVYSLRCTCIKGEKLPSSPRKYTIKCLTCGIGLKSIHSDFAKAHLVENPTHLEYRVVVEIRQIDDTKKSPRGLPTN